MAATIHSSDKLVNALARALIDGGVIPLKVPKYALGDAGKNACVGDNNCTERDAPLECTEPTSNKAAPTALAEPPVGITLLGVYNGHSHADSGSVLGTPRVMRNAGVIKLE